jgi:hypothetical protein
LNGRGEPSQLSIYALPFGMLYRIAPAESYPPLTICGWIPPSRSQLRCPISLGPTTVKYGALPNGGGRVTIAWEQCQANRLKLVWQENGGPMVSPPKQKGFGSHLIERAFGGQLGSARPQGLSCILEIGSHDG